MLCSFLSKPHHHLHFNYNYLFPSHKKYHSSSKLLIPTTRISALSEGVNLAISQQSLAFGICFIGEGIYTRTQLREGEKGRPQISSIVAAAIGYIITFSCLTSENNVFEVFGVFMGTGISAFLLINSLFRFVDTEDDPREWPGPKTWPAGISLASFFVTLAFIQALLTLF